MKRLCNLPDDTVRMVEYYAHRLGKSEEQVVEEALRRYFIQIEEELAAKDERALTTFDFDEFYDGLDIG